MARAPPSVMTFLPCSDAMEIALDTAVKMDEL